MSYPQQCYLECQDCGTWIRRLDDSERRDMARNPYNWVAWCPNCWAEVRKRIEAGEILP